MLSVEASCEIDDLISELVKATHKTHDEVETACFDVYLYPCESKTFVMPPYHTGIDWLNEGLEKVLKECGQPEIYITNAI